MLVFLDFEASSLGRHSYPIEVGWVFEDGGCESHLIRPAPGWTDWDPAAERIHGLSRARIEADGEPVEAVAGRMVEVLGGHDLLASAPSWDGKWMSVLLRAAGLPRHVLRLRDSEDARREAVEAALVGAVPDAALANTVEDLLTLGEVRSGLPAHRALADALDERRRWRAVRDEAERLAAQSPAGLASG